MTTEWIGRAYIAVPESAINDTLKTNFAQRFVDGGCMETLANEMKLLDSHVKLSRNGQLPIEARTINTPIRPAMLSSLVLLAQTITNSRVMVVLAEDMTIDLGNGFGSRAYLANEVYRTNGNVKMAFNSVDGRGAIVTWSQWLTGLGNMAQTGLPWALSVIPEAAS